MKEILIPVSPGELLDRITILQIKSQRISDKDKLVNVLKELDILNEIWSKIVSDDPTIEQMTKELITINKSLWDIENNIRDEEKHRNFGERFIELARSVYITNDKRADMKKKVNIYLGSIIIEEKSYQDYS
ncbi:MAG TPA: hypothetical protein ENI68_08200 [Gammaproteobacteria bacterium]|nr:hypothetical protein [Gammaproteobacteria bacterium]